MKVSPNLKWFNFWVGWYIDHRKRNLYLNILPMIGIKINYGPINHDYQFSPYNRFYHRWYDFWIGAFYERKTKNIYFQPIPTLGVKI